MPCAENCYFHTCRLDSCCQTGFTLNKYKLPEPQGHWHPWLSLTTSPGVSHHATHGQGPHFSPADPNPQAHILVWPPMIGVPPAASRLPWSLQGWWDGLVRPCPTTLWGAPSLPVPGISRPLPIKHLHKMCSCRTPGSLTRNAGPVWVLAGCQRGYQRVGLCWTGVPVKPDGRQEALFLLLFYGSTSLCFNKKIPYVI